MWRAAAAAAVALGALGGGVALVAAPAAGEAAGRFVAPDGRDADNDCAVRARPCATFGAAYRAATPGDEVEVAGGTYPAQRVDYVADRTSEEDVVIRPAPGARVTVDGGLRITARHVTVAGIQVRDIELNVNTEVGTVADLTAQDITLRDVDARSLQVISASDVRVIGGDLGPSSACGGPHGGGNNAIRQYPGGPQPTNITFDGVRVHDVHSYDLARCHTEGLAIFAGRNVTVRNSRFWGNDVMNVFVQANSGPVAGVVLENNWFARPTRSGGTGVGAWTLDINGVRSDIVVRHNSFNGPFVFEGADGAYANVVVAGNIADRAGGCNPGITYAYNAWIGGTCAATDRRLTAVPYVNTADSTVLDYHLTGGAAQDMIPPAALQVATDIDGQARPAGNAGDAGADERAPASPAGTAAATAPAGVAPTATATAAAPTPTATAAVAVPWLVAGAPGAARALQLVRAGRRLGLFLPVRVRSRVAARARLRWRGGRARVRPRVVPARGGFPAAIVVDLPVRARRAEARGRRLMLVLSVRHAVKNGGVRRIFRTFSVPRRA